MGLHDSMLSKNKQEIMGDLFSLWIIEEKEGNIKP